MHMALVCLHYDSLTIIYEIGTENKWSYSTRLDIILLEPLLFNIFLADLFFVVNDSDIASYVNSNTPNVIADNMDDLITSLEQALNPLFEWLQNNLLKSNTETFHF